MNNNMKPNNEYKEGTLKEKIKSAHSLETHKLKNLTFFEKIDYIWTYYKVPILATILALSILISVVHKLLNPDPESVLYVLAVNSNPMIEESLTDTFFDELLLEHSLDLDEFQGTLNTSLQVSFHEDGTADNPQMLQVLVTLLMAGEVDVLTADEESFITMASQGYVAPLDTYLTNEEIENLGDRVIYATNYETNETQAVGITAEETSAFVTNEYYASAPVSGMIYRSSHQNLAKEFLLKN